MGDAPDYEPEDFDWLEEPEPDWSGLKLQAAETDLLVFWTDLTQLIDRARYYNEPPTAEILEELKRQVEETLKIFR